MAQSGVGQAVILHRKSIRQCFIHAISVPFLNIHLYYSKEDTAIDHMPRLIVRFTGLQTAQRGP